MDEQKEQKLEADNAKAPVDYQAKLREREHARKSVKKAKKARKAKKKKR